MRRNTPESLLKKMIPEPNTGCWLWAEHVNDKGYGMITYQGRYWMAHRLSYTLFKGPIPEGKVLMHTCDTPACINPAHLIPGTDLENARDRDTKQRRQVPTGAKNWNAGITDEQAEQVKGLRRDGYQLTAIAEMTGVHYSTIRRVLYAQGRFAHQDRTYLTDSKHAVGYR